MNQLSNSSRSNLISDLAASNALLNCLVKEFALPMKTVKYEWPEDMRGIPIGVFFNGEMVKGTPLHITMPNQQEYFILVDRQDNLGGHYYLSDIYGKKNEVVWHYLDFEKFVSSLIETCSDAVGHTNEELTAQIFESRALKEKIYEAAIKNQTDALKNYPASEQSLWFGHPTHPAPKARLWSVFADQPQFSPEFGQQAALHQFEIERSDLWLKSNDLNLDQILGTLANQHHVDKEKAIICLHPVQAKLFLNDERVKHLLASGQIKDLGCQGDVFTPTASIRTLFSSKNEYFIKGSLNVRITNCVRKNAWYELESTVLIDEIFKKLHKEQPEKLGGFVPVEEPAVLSWIPKSSTEQDAIWFKEQTGIILRKNFCKEEGELNCLMAGTVFGRSINLTPHVTEFIEKNYKRECSDKDLLDWFKSYQSLLLRPVLNLFYNFGIVMEPHLQNTILVHQNGQPLKVLLRDFEGVKLTDDLGVQLIAQKDIHARVRQSMQYTRENGWKRICYCLFVNNLCEAILALTWKKPFLAKTMWNIVLSELKEIRDHLTVSTPELDQLIDGDVIHCKTNFKVRLSGEADRKAGYVELQAPWEANIV